MNIESVKKVVASWEDKYYATSRKEATRRIMYAALIKEACERYDLPKPFLGTRKVAPAGSGLPCNGAVGASSNIIRIV